MGLDLNIVLAGGVATFGAGQVIQGEVLVNVGGSKEQKLRGVKLEIFGKARVSWSTGSGKKKTTLVNNETYVDYKITLTDALKGKEALPPGNHSFPFAYQLPLNIPSTFQQRIGRVFYFIKAVLDIPWGLDKSKEMPITIINHTALEPRYQQPVSLDNSKEFAAVGCFGKGGSAYATFKVNKTGFSPGETVNISVQVRLEGEKVTIKEVKAVLMERLVFHARNRTKKSANTLATERLMTELKNETKEFQLRLLIPPTPMPDMTFCTIIDVVRQIEISVIPAGMHADLTSPAIPVVIGAELPPPPPPPAPAPVAVPTVVTEPEVEPEEQPEEKEGQKQEDEKESDDEKDEDEPATEVEEVEADEID